jgi:hypothetical protein
LVAIGAKRIETRSWRTDYHGPLAIHAGKNDKFISMHSKSFICNRIYFHEILTNAGMIWWPFGPLPRGAIIATCELITCQKIDENDWLSHQKGWQKDKHFWEASEQEKAFGDYTVGRYMWFLANIELLPEPIYINGAMGLWEWEAKEV